MRGTRCPTTWRSASSPHGVGFRDGSSTTFVSSRPSISTLVVTKRLAIWRLSSHGHHGAYDLRVGAAPTQIAAHSASHVVFGWIPVVAQERDGSEDLTGRTESALQRVVFDERRLDGMQRSVVGEAFNGDDRPIVAGDCQRQTRVDGDTVEQNRTRAAFAA